MLNVLKAKTMAECDRATIESGTPSVLLMQRAAQSIYDSHEFKGKVYIVCGKGNNGGDGVALADIMTDKGLKPYVFFIDKNVSEDSCYFYERLKSKGYDRIYGISECDYNADIIVDCIFGTGFKGVPCGIYAQVIDNINKSSAYKIAADIPSGLNADNGLFELCVKADKTVSMQFAKSGHFLNDGKDMTGELIIADIGISLCKEEYKLIQRSDVAKLFPLRKSNTHKGSYGKSALIGGCTNYAGALKLANTGLCALRSGGGLNMLIVPESLANVYAQAVCESTIYPMTDKNGYMLFDKEKLDVALKGVDCLAIGMGIGADYGENIKIVEYILKNYAIKVLIDADGLNSLALDTDILKDKKSEVVLTPHVKEMSRLCKKEVKEILADPIGVANEFAEEYGVTVLLKGATSVITDGEKVFLVANGGPELSKGGSGDTLSGVITGLLSQGFTPVQSAYTGAYITAYAAHKLAQDYSQYGVLPSDVAKSVAEIIKDI